MPVLDVKGLFHEVEALALQCGLHAVVGEDPPDPGADLVGLRLYLRVGATRDGMK